MEFTTSTSQKKQILRENPETKLFWKLCYNPFWVYHIREIPEVLGNVEGNISCLKPIRRLLTDLHKRRFTGHEAHYTTREVLQNCNLSTRELLTRILNRDARCGVNIKLINSVWPNLIPTHDVMLAQKLDWKKLKYPCIASTKIDGVRALASQEAILTRAGKKLYGLENLQSQIPRGIMLDGELTIPGMNFQEGCGEIRSYNECPNAVLHVFDIPDWNTNFLERLEHIRRLSIWFRSIKPVPCVVCHNEAEVRECFQENIRRGYEGLVVKPLNYKYERKRSKHWMKLKAMESYDLKVIGKFEGTGKYRGMLGGIVVNFKGVEVRVGTGFSDQERDFLWDTNILGKIAEVECHEITPDKSMRHPRFKGFRFDKEEESYD